MKILNEYDAYAFVKEDDGIILRNGQGFVAEFDEVYELCKGLLEYASKHDKELKTHNLKREIESKREWDCFFQTCQETDRLEKEKRRKNAKKGYVYLLRCGGKYKIGFSKNVDRRIKQLDTRPFKIELLLTSEEKENAYDIEQQLHEKYKKYRIDGEWYEFDTDILSQVYSEFKDWWLV